MAGNFPAIRFVSKGEKMDESQTSACYTLAKNIYPDLTQITSAANFIAELTEMNKGSARVYINNFFNMRNGEKLKRCMAKEDAIYYFKRLYEDFGLDGLKKGLDSFQKYLDDDKQNHPGLQAVIDEFKFLYGVFEE
ncbi:MAG: hypothetical protein NC041_01615 [Bacteroides sp.]|nr:hypothetical protein [Prevotella sp.]MCM1407699.1 hypothetical protein [Treponema brennaborense]MCM1469151.1 hypothetical protein [Bacteroides sp.]